MYIRCIKQVKNESLSEVYFTENVIYSPYEEYPTELIVIDDTGQDHTVAIEEGMNWENDKWFVEHFVIL